MGISTAAFTGAAQQYLQGRQNKQQQEQTYKNAIMEALIKAKIEQQNPLNQMLNLGKLAEVAKALNIPLSALIGQQNAQGQGGFPSPQMPPQIGAPQITSQMRPQTPQPSGATGIMPFQNQQGQDIGNTPQLRGTNYEKDVWGNLNPTKYEDIGAEAEKTGITESTKLSSKQSESYLKASENVRRLQGAFSELVAQGKLMAKEQGGLGIGPAIKGATGRLGARITGETDPYKSYSGITGFEGQLAEVALSLSPILTGQNRIIEGVVRMIKTTLPKKISSEADFSRNIHQSLRNAYRIALAIEKNVISPEEVKKLNSQNPWVIQNRLKALISSVKLSKDEEMAFEEMWQNVSSTPAAKPINIFRGSQEQSQGDMVQIRNKRTGEIKMVPRSAYGQ